MEISIVILTIDSEDYIHVLLNSIKKNKIQEKTEVIVVDAGSKDNTISKVEEFGFVKIIKEKRISKGKARNIGVQKAKGDIIVYLDSDTEVLPGWYEALIKSIKCSDIVAGYLTDPNMKDIGRVPALIDGCDISYPTCNIAYKREVFEKVGGFIEVQRIPEDCEFHYRCAKAGYTINYNSKMKVLHHQRFSRFGFSKQAFWNGEARYELNKLYPELKNAHQHGLSVDNIVRMGFGFLGFTVGRFLRKKDKVGNRYAKKTNS